AFSPSMQRTPSDTRDVGYNSKVSSVLLRLLCTAIGTTGHEGWSSVQGPLGPRSKAGRRQDERRPRPGPYVRPPSPRGGAGGKDWGSQTQTSPNFPQIFLHIRVYTAITPPTDTHHPPTDRHPHPPASSAGEHEQSADAVVSAAGDTDDRVVLPLGLAVHR